MDLREQIGQRLVTGFPGTELTEDFRRMVREYKISNVILFRENITDCAQLKQLCGEIQALVRRETGHGAFITADQEGGLVTRLPGDAVNVPGAMAIAATGDPENAYRAGLLTGRELRALGVNFDLAPSVDVNSNPENPVIGARSYGDTPQEVSRYANRMIRGLLDGGVLCSAKHFPGHGDTDTDSHLALRGQKHGGAGTDGAAALPGGSACGRARGDDDTYPVPAARTGASSGNDVPAHHDGAAAGADGL